jgi:hypothetical protein
MRTWIALSLLALFGCKDAPAGAPAPVGQAVPDRLAAPGEEKPPQEETAKTVAEMAKAYEAEAACFAPIAAIIAKLPASTWAAEGDLAPADRAAVENAIGFSYAPGQTFLLPYGDDILTRFGVGTKAECGHVSADVIVVRVEDCHEISSGTSYRDQYNVEVQVMNATCSGALVWVQLSTATVLAKVSANSSGSPGILPDRASDREVMAFRGKALSDARGYFDDKLAKGIAVWTPGGDPARAKRLKGLGISEHCLENPLAKGCS